MMSEEVARRFDLGGGVVKPGPELDLIRRVGHAMARGKNGLLFVSETNFAWCYIYGGEWVANCPAKCGNVELMTEKADRDRGDPAVFGTRKTMFFCSYCKAVYTSVRWPDNAEELAEPLARRPMRHNRNWYPEGHPTAVEFFIPDGQTPEELWAENREHGVD